MAALAVLLQGCIIVEDFGAYWDKGFVDECVNEIMVSKMSEDGNEPPPANGLMRSLKIGKHTFLMMRDAPEDKGGNLMRYEIRNNEFISYRLNEDKRAEFLNRFGNSQVRLTNETATIPLLNKKAMALLETIADDESYWLETSHERYNSSRRSDCAAQ